MKKKTAQDAALGLIGLFGIEIWIKSLTQPLPCGLIGLFGIEILNLREADSYNSRA